MSIAFDAGSPGGSNSWESIVSQLERHIDDVLVETKLQTDAA